MQYMEFFMHFFVKLVISLVKLYVMYILSTVWNLLKLTE